MDAKVAVITGASSGIGEQTAMAFAARRYAVVLAARRMDRLNGVADRCRQLGGRVEAIATDVSDGGQVYRLVDETVKRFGRLDVMVNNAGFGVNGRVWETTEDQMRRIMEVNFFGVFHGCRAAAPVMIAQKSGHIFNVSSVIGKRGTPFNGAYCATKFAVIGLTDSLRVELAPYNVRATSVCPGLTQTEFFAHVEGGTEKKESSFKAVRTRQSPAVVARRIVASVGRNSPELVFTPGGKILSFIGPLWPRFTDWFMRFYHNDLAENVPGHDT
ncbi:MAG: SDR family NAD(P)-dependent oxidoreductase [Planctomycetes bacterium]|nr:SDR family NAD(P)-dependent oxidoreductase [Planctomycetota bacterium]